MSAALYAITLPQPWPWAVEVRNTTVINLPVPRPPQAHLPEVGAYVAVCAAEGYDEAAADWMGPACGVSAPLPGGEEVPAGVVVAVGRVSAVTLWPDAPRPSRWYRGPAGVWLEDVHALSHVPCPASPVGMPWTLPAETHEAVRSAWRAQVRLQREARAAWEAQALKAQRLDEGGLKARVLKLCTCKRALVLCGACRAWRCTTPGCTPHTCVPVHVPVAQVVTGGAL